MALLVTFRPEALDDLAAAHRWYEERLPGLGRDFLNEIEQKLDQISEAPDHFQKIRGPVRRAITRHFPYSIFFVEDAGLIVVLGVLHHARDPRLWRGRAR